MAQLTNAKPGDLIKSADWNALIALVQGLSGPAAAGPITVPSLFGLTLGNAIAIITLPSAQLTVGNIFDTLGNKVNAAVTNAGPLLVLNQMPPAGTNVYAGSSVNLVVSPLPGSTIAAPLLPSITSYNPVPVPIGAQLEIDGQNFDPLNSNNKVTIGGIATAAPAAGSNTVKLFVVVPTGIAGAPTTAGVTLSVPVIVTTPAGPANGTTTITAPLANPLPTITGFNPPNPGGGNVGQTITISGTGFDTAAANDRVIFDPTGSPIPVTPTAATSTQLTVTIPTGISGLTQPGQFRSVPISVEAHGQVSPAVSYTISN
jgi:IPT/TIG domain